MVMCLLEKRQSKKNEERLQSNELRQVFIDKYRTGHFDSIQSLKKVIKGYMRKIVEQKPKNQQRRRDSRNSIKNMDKRSY